jgi:hypothetical protein
LQAFITKDDTATTLQRYRLVFYLSLAQYKLSLMLIYQRMDALCRIKQTADGSVVIERVDQICHVLAHIDLGVPRLGQKLGTTVGQIGRENTINNAIGVRLIELIATFREQAEGGEAEDSSGTLVLELLGYINQRIRYYPTIVIAQNGS